MIPIYEISAAPHFPQALQIGATDSDTARSRHFRIDGRRRRFEGRRNYGARRRNLYRDHRDQMIVRSHHSIIPGLVPGMAIQQ